MKKQAFINTVKTHLQERDVFFLLMWVFILVGGILSGILTYNFYKPTPLAQSELDTYTQVLSEMEDSLKQKGLDVTEIKVSYANEYSDTTNTLTFSENSLNSVSKSDQIFMTFSLILIGAMFSAIFYIMCCFAYLWILRIRSHIKEFKAYFNMELNKLIIHR